MNYTGKEYTVYPQMDSVYATDIHSVKLVVRLYCLSFVRPSLVRSIFLTNLTHTIPIGYVYFLSKGCELVFNKKFLSQMARL